MVRIKRYDKYDKLDWNKFNGESKTPLFMFDRDYMDYHSDRFKDHSLMFYDKDNLVAILPCSEHGDELRSHGGLTYGGFIVNDSMRQSTMNDVFKSLIEYCRIHDFNSMLYKTIPDIFHRQPSEEDLYAIWKFGGQLKKIEASTVINLTEPLKMSKLRRRQANKGCKAGVQIIVDDTPDAYDFFMKIQDRILMEYHNVKAAHNGQEIHMLHERFPENIHLYTAIYEDQIIGGSIVFIYENVIHTQYLCANEKARRIGALDLTIMRIIEDFAGQKKWLDFGISTEGDGHILNEGLISQKEGFGGRTKIYNTWNIIF